MMRTPLAVVLVLGTLGSTLIAADKELAMSIRGWGKIVDPDGDCQIDLDKTTVKLTVPGTPHDFAAELQQWNAPRIVRNVRGDFIAEVKIGGTFNPQPKSTIEGRKPYNGAGLLVISDNNNHVSLQRAAFWAGDHVRHYLNFEYRQDGQSTVGRNSMTIDDGDCWLRLERHGGRMFAMTSTDDVNWKSYDPIEVELPNKLKIGVVAINSAKEPFACTMESYSLFQSGQASVESGERTGQSSEGTSEGVGGKK